MGPGFGQGNKSLCILYLDAPARPDFLWCCSDSASHPACPEKEREVSLISASLLAGLASFDFPIYLCQEFSFEFFPACLSVIFV